MEIVGYRVFTYSLRSLSTLTQSSLSLDYKTQSSFQFEQDNTEGATKVVFSYKKSEIWKWKSERQKAG